MKLSILKNLKFDSNFNLFSNSGGNKMLLGSPSRDQLVDHNDERVTFKYFKPKTDSDGWMSAKVRNSNFFSGA